MKYLILLITMIFFHMVDDYYLQGWLASAKQKSWWEKNAADEMYKNDYKMALTEHALSWTIMIHIPIVAYLYHYNLLNFPVPLFILLFGFNWYIHAVVDDLKVNKKRINLIQDQLSHLVQILLTWLFYASCIAIKIG